MMVCALGLCCSPPPPGSRLPPPGPQVRCGGAAISRLAASPDDALLFAATADGCLFVFDVRDRDAGRLAT